MKIKKENGITLIALIITILALVILSAVGISTVYNSRIIEYAMNGAENYWVEGVKENKILNEAIIPIDSAVNNLRELMEERRTNSEIEVLEYIN